MRGGLVQDEHGRAGQQRPRQHDALPLAARQLASLLAHERVQAVGEPHDPVPDPGAAQRVLDLARRSASGRARRTLSRMLAENRCDSCPATAIARRTSPGDSRAGRVRRASPAPPRGRGSAAAGWRRWSCRRRWGPTSATRSPGSSRRLTPSSAGRACRGSGRATSSSATANGQRGAGTGRGGVAHGRLAVGELEHPPAGRERRRQLAGGRGERRDRLERRQREQRQRRDQHAVELARRRTRRSRRASTPATVTPVTTSPSASPIRSRARRAGRVCTSVASAARTRSSAAALAAEGDELGRTAEELDELGGQLAPRAGLAPRRRGAEIAGERGDGEPAVEQAGGEHETRGREERGGHADRDGAGQERDHRR